MIDVTELTDEELAEVATLVATEQRRRSLPGQVDALNRAYLSDSGVAEGEPWRQPTGAHDAYPQWWIVSHGGKPWESQVMGNVWEPGVSGWREVAGEGQVPSWVQPTGAHDAYHTGDRVRHNGEIWVSNSDNNVWEPGVFGWDKEESE